MSLLGTPEPVSGAVPAVAWSLPAPDVEPLVALSRTAAALARSGGRWVAMARALADAYRYLDARLLEGRREAAEVRYALGLPMTATCAEVVAAIRTRGGR